MRSVKQVDAEIAKREDEIQALREERKKIIEMDPDRRMAEQMHTMFCTWNHTDGCDWHYGSWDRPTNARNKWLKKAKEAIAQGLTLEEVKRVYDIARG